MSDMLNELKGLKEKVSIYENDWQYGQDVGSKQGIGGNIPFGPPMQKPDPGKEIFPDVQSHAENGPQTSPSTFYSSSLSLLKKIEHLFSLNNIYYPWREMLNILRSKWDQELVGHLGHSNLHRPQYNRLLLEIMGNLDKDSQGLTLVR